MDTVDALLVSGFVALLVALVGSRLSARIAAKKRWIAMLGVALIVLSVILGGPELVRGFRDGMAHRSK